MKFLPAKQKFKKYQKGKSFNKIKILKTRLKYGQIGLRLMEPFRITSKQLKTLYNSLKKKMKKKGRVILTVFPQTPITKKPTEVRMGKGKGGVSFWAAKIRAGTILCEISTFRISFGLKVLKKLSFKLPIKTKVMIRSV